MGGSKPPEPFASGRTDRSTVIGGQTPFAQFKQISTQPPRHLTGHVELAL
jgi:hypothetical protein